VVVVVAFVDREADSTTDCWKAGASHSGRKCPARDSFLFLQCFQTKRPNLQQSFT
jgi:hypothetical protein